jgi:Arc/MetJ family transcription regulator
MTKRLVEIDDELLARARTVAGTDTIRATVEAALRSLVDQDTALRHVARLREPGVLDIEHLDEARRPRTGTSG